MLRHLCAHAAQTTIPEPVLIVLKLWYGGDVKQREPLFIFSNIKKKRIVFYGLCSDIFNLNTIFIFRTLPSSVIPVLQLVATADSLPHLHHQVCHVLPLLVWVLLVIFFFRYLPGLPVVVLLLAALDPASPKSSSGMSCPC